jgi:hypothetical protein
MDISTRRGRADGRGRDRAEKRPAMSGDSMVCWKPATLDEEKT